MGRRFSVKATKRFERKLSRLGLSLQRQILDRAYELGDDPYVGKRLKGSLEGLFSLRIGDYRVVYWIDEGKAVVWVVEVEHRRSVYR